MASESEAVTIYALCDEAGAVHYVGQTRRPEQRCREHQKAWPDWTLRVLLVVEGAVADAAERAQIALHRARGCMLVNGTTGGSGQRTALSGPVVVRLTQRRFEILERLAAREELPVAVVARRLLSERLDALDDERVGHDLRSG
jgi:predicted GIY-YIG superfamily endonuclease